MSIVTSHARALMGTQGPVISAPHPLDASTLRRFVQAVMEPNSVHFDAGSAQRAGFRAPIAPPLWPAHAIVRAAEDADPLDQLHENPDWDGAAGNIFGGLPSLDLPAKRILNGGTEAEFFRFAEIGDLVSAQSEYLDIVEREGRSGLMAIVRVRTTYKRQDGEALARVTMSLIHR